MSDANDPQTPDETESAEDATDLSIDSDLVEETPDQDFESRIERGDPDQFNVRYAPARKFLVAH
jgi:hypothetical protein